MGDELGFDSRAMTKTGAEMQNSSQQIKNTHQGFDGEINAEKAGAFGDDDLGSLIGGIYDAIHEIAFGSFGDNNSEIDTRTKNVQAMATTYQRGEDRSQQDADDLGRNIEV